MTRAVGDAWKRRPSCSSDLPKRSTSRPTMDTPASILTCLNGSTFVNASKSSANLGGRMPRSASAVGRSRRSVSVRACSGPGSTSRPSIFRIVAPSVAREAVERLPRRTVSRTSGASIVPRFITATSARPSAVASTRRVASLIPDIDQVRSDGVVELAPSRLEMERRPSGQGHARGVVAGVGDACPGDDGERRHAVRCRMLGACDVLYVGAASGHGVSDEGAMASPRHRLRTHHGNDSIRGERVQLREPSLEVVGEHVVSEPPEAGVAPRGVG